MERPKITRDIFSQVRDFIYEKCGIYFGDGKEYLLEDRLSRRLSARNLSSYEEYLFFLRYDPKKEEELRALYNSVTTNETSFFRDINQLEAFRTGILPKIMERNSSRRTIRIWSAACSTGEEPYTMAMILSEEGILLNGWKVEILASDISENVLNSAKRGVYGDYAVRNTPERYLKRYFTNNNNSYTVKPDVARLVRFANINLVDSLQVSKVRGMDVIFCRNVLIYFDDHGKRKVISFLHDSLVKGGFLMVGFSESLFSITRAFRPVGIRKCVAYQKI